MKKLRHDIPLESFEPEVAEVLILDVIKALGFQNVRGISVREKGGDMKAAVTFTHGKAKNTFILDIAPVTAFVAGGVFVDLYNQWMADIKRAIGFKESAHIYNVARNIFALSVGG